MNIDVYQYDADKRLYNNILDFLLFVYLNICIQISLELYVYDYFLYKRDNINTLNTYINIYFILSYRLGFTNLLAG